jgi:hypothetical protein
MEHGHGLSNGVQNGLAWFHLLMFGANLGFGIYHEKVTHNKRASLAWYVVSLVFLVHALLYFAHTGFPTLPQWFKDMSNEGIQRGLQTLDMPPGPPSPTGAMASPVTPNDYITLGVFGLLVLSLLLWAADAVTGYLVPTLAPGFDKLFKRLHCGMPLHQRMVMWWIIVSVLMVVYAGTGAVTYFVLANALFVGALVWRRFLTLPNVAWAILNITILFGLWSMTDENFRLIITKPDNVPIVFLGFTVGFFTWLSLRRAVLNDERIERNEPVLEKLEEEKVLVWPDLVYTELICMVVVTVLLVVWSVALPAPLEQPAASAKTPNPSKAPWYFLGLQEMLVYYDPWLAGVVFPTIIIIGLIAIPYIDYNQKGNGYYTYKERPFAIINFLFGFIVLWVVLIFLGTFLRGPNWNFFGLYERWDVHKTVPLNNVNLSDYFWIRGLGTVWEHPANSVSLTTILMRELPGFLLVIGYFLFLPPLLARTILRSYFLRMGFIRYMILVMLILTMLSLPIKMVLRWTINLKYIVAIPEYSFHI